jgi:PIN domain nuclease of toxin-antitoxin system
VIVLDTHAWVWAVSDPAKLGKDGRSAIRRKTPLGIAAISCWELSMLSVRGRIELDRDPVTWMEDSFSSLGIELLPLTPAVAVLAGQFQSLHGDPADRLIVATALAHGAVLLTRDEKLRDSDVVRTMW